MGVPAPGVQLLQGLLTACPDFPGTAPIQAKTSALQGTLFLHLHPLPFPDTPWPFATSLNLVKLPHPFLHMKLEQNIVNFTDCKDFAVCSAKIPELNLGWKTKHICSEKVAD